MENKYVERCSVRFLQGIFLNQGLNQGAVWAGFCSPQTRLEVPVLGPDGWPGLRLLLPQPLSQGSARRTSQGRALVAAPPVLPEQPPPDRAAASWGLESSRRLQSGFPFPPDSVTQQWG